MGANENTTSKRLIKKPKSADNKKRDQKMGKLKAGAVKKLKPLEITYAYAEYKTRHETDLDNGLANWADNLMYFMKAKKAKK